jgi:predicted CXXCH cytochrome family protein
VLVCAVVAGLSAWRPRRDAPPASGVARKPASVALDFVGEEVCASCHAREAAIWNGSHHQLAMQRARVSTVLGDFSTTEFHYAGVTSTFRRRADQFLAETDGPDGALHEYPIDYTFGVSPLQQYLVAFPGGRFQALEMAWDARRKEAGGQRWFHLHPDERITSRDVLHWTGPTENWSSMCADCHSTNVRKRYDARTRSYSTSFAEISVSCEACHGPGSRHVEWARDRSKSEVNKGLSIALDERRNVSWSREPASGQPRRSVPRQSERELEMCARCHSRRGLIHEDHVHGQAVGDDYYVALLDDDLYYVDGQVKAEVYEYGSFIQSRMFAEGVTCTDCHDPHRPELRLSGDNLCLKCHSQQRYFTDKHHFHREDSAGARCVACHMPAKTFMVVDARRDHSLRVPRPDLSVELGVPNPCTECHADRSAEWAARVVEKWYGHTPSGYQRFAQTLAAANQAGPGSQRLLSILIDDRGQPAIARASAIARAAHGLTSRTLASIRGALEDSHALVRRAAVEALADVDPQERSRWLAPRLDDQVRSVRVAAAAALAGVPPEWLSSSERAALDAATAELLAVQELNADQPEAHLALARWYAKGRRFDDAETELKRALAIAPQLVPAIVNLADLYRLMDRDGDAESVLREALSHAQDRSLLLHALGLVLVREQRLREAIGVLGEAARLRPGDPRFGYVHAVALYSDGRKQEAIDRLEEVLALHPYHRDSLSALRAYRVESGDIRKALQCARRLEALDAP